MINKDEQMVSLYNLGQLKQTYRTSSGKFFNITFRTKQKKNILRCFCLTFKRVLLLLFVFDWQQQHIIPRQMFKANQILINEMNRRIRNHIKIRLRSSVTKKRINLFFNNYSNGALEAIRLNTCSNFPHQCLFLEKKRPE